MLTYFGFARNLSIKIETPPMIGVYYLYALYRRVIYIEQSEKSGILGSDTVLGCCYNRKGIYTYLPCQHTQTVVICKGMSKVR